MKIVVFCMLLLVPKRILTNQIPSSVLSAAPSSDVVDDLTETPPTTTSLVVESTYGRIIPKIVSVHPPVEQGTTKSPTNASVTTTTRPITSIIPSKQSGFIFTTIEITQNRPEEQDEASFEQVPGKDASRNKNDTKPPPPTSAIERQTSPKNRRVTNSIISTNEFPMPGEDRDDDDTIDAGETRPNSSLSYPISTILSEYPSDPAVIVAGILSNSTMSQDIIVISVLAQLLAYFHKNSDRILVVVLESVCIGLFLTVLFLLFRCDRRKGFCGWKLKEETAEQGRDGECASLMGASHRSQTESSSTNPGNVFNTQPPQTFASDHHGNHVDYINRVQDEHRRRKRRSKTHTLLKKCCSCCCTNAPWQRDHSDSGEGYRIPPRESSASDDDIISVGGSNRNQFEGPLPHAPPSLQLDEVDNRFPPVASSGPASDSIPYADDNTSEYEFQDNNHSQSTARSTQEPPPLVRPTSLQATFRPAPPLTQYNQQTFSNNNALHPPLPITQSSFHSSTQRQQCYDPPKRKREPPPFPKPVAYGYQPQSSQHSPHYTNQRSPHSQQPFQSQLTRTAHQPMSNHMTQQRHPQAFVSSMNDPYVSLRPQQHHPNTARTLNLTRNDTMPERRQSLYDNSLPRDSPMYEYYQRQQTNRQELPGTRNINQYYT